MAAPRIARSSPAPAALDLLRRLILINAIAREFR